MKSFIEFHVFISMILLHLIADYNLQGILASMKQKSWWKQQTDDKMYDNDWQMALFEHSLMWSIFITIPITLYSFYSYQDTTMFILIELVINTILHFAIDDLKANVHLLNLVQDQLLHFVQISATYWIFTEMYF